ncbi:MAG: YeeE/YedE family protein [Cyclobacteriaceae bacterium]|jgi:hypothetical protein|nr:YeeE/YedE family protein [Cyclobacteriaceae bacterium]
MQFLQDVIFKPWPWYVVGPLIGLTVPLLLLIENKTLGVSANLRHVCAALLPVKPRFFHYNWKAHQWNLLFAFGILLAGIVANVGGLLHYTFQIHPALVGELSYYNVEIHAGSMPSFIFSSYSLLSMQNILMIVIGGLMVGFGTRYAGGCTSGHAIAGLSGLQWPSLIATICFMLGGIVSANFILPLFLNQ